jgi:membrane-associated phospholipid phosphatase
MEPLRNSFELFRFEYFLNLDWEIALQRAVLLNSRFAVHVFNFIYAWGYWLILAGSLAYLYVRHGNVYRTLRNAIMISGFVGFFIFASYPVAPPRLAPVGIVDTVELSSSLLEEVARPSALTNQNAAMPSFHFGWILLCGVCLSMTLRRWTSKALVLALPVLMAVTIIVTGNHYVVDAIVGGVLCLACLVPWRLRRRHAQRASQRFQQV